MVATPIGNLRDITLRALETLAAADLVACEDTRVTRKLLDHYGSRPDDPLSRPQRRDGAAEDLEKLAAGGGVALVSDAGTPLISDPAYKLVRAASAAGHAVTAAPGASAALMALTVAGLPTDRFFFEGFLPAKEAARRTRIAELARIPATLVLFESGPRLAATLADLAAGLGAREAAVCRELTKLHEEVRRGDLGALAARLCGGRRDARRNRAGDRAAGGGRAAERRGDRCAAARRARAHDAQGGGGRSRRRDRRAAPRRLQPRARAGERPRWRAAT